MTRVVLAVLAVLAVAAISATLASCHPFATIHNLYLAACDTSDEKSCVADVIVDDGYGRQCVYSKATADNLGAEGQQGPDCK